MSDSPRWVQSYELIDHREVSSARPTEVSLTLIQRLAWNKDFILHPQELISIEEVSPNLAHLLKTRTHLGGGGEFKIRR